MTCYKAKHAVMPYAITSKLQREYWRDLWWLVWFWLVVDIAKHLRKGRQEDSHEFLRYAIDALQKSCLAGQPPYVLHVLRWCFSKLNIPRKIDHKIAETTWVHKLFGGRLRSRVQCQSCGHNSDTFDSILDLSIDIHRCDSLKEALKKFTAIDYLKGTDKYKCEK